MKAPSENPLGLSGKSTARRTHRGQNGFIYFASAGAKRGKTPCAALRGSFYRKAQKIPPIRSTGEWGAQSLIGLSICTFSSISCDLYRSFCLLTGTPLRQSLK